VWVVVSLSKQRFYQHGRHTKIGITNFGDIFHHIARVRKQKTLKILCFVVSKKDLPSSRKRFQFLFISSSPLFINDSSYFLPVEAKSV
jgi:hypothetical protein